jgi:hypothetical protein
MSIEVMIYADASARAVAAARAVLGAVGPVYVLAHRTPGVATPPMGLLAVADEVRHCLDHRETFGEPDPPAPADWDGQPHPGVSAKVWGRCRPFPAPGLRAMGVLSRFAAQTGARVWVVCEHERGDDPYDEWAWLFAPARPRSAMVEMIFAYGGDAGRVLWQRDLIGPDPWRVSDAAPSGSPIIRLMQRLELPSGALPGPATAAHKGRAL